VITSFRHKGLQRFFVNSDQAGIPASHRRRIERMLDLLDACRKPDDVAVIGYKFHELRGARKGTYSVAVSGNLRITFEFESGHATNVNLEDYH
jgi:toxin HigB-1